MIGRVNAPPARRRALPTALAAFLAVALGSVLAAPGQGGSPAPASPLVLPVPVPAAQAPPPADLLAISSGARPATIAKLMTAAPALSQPGGGELVERLDTSVRPGGGPTSLLVLDRATVGGAEWLRVLLPQRPNGATGWIPSALTRLSSTPWKIVITVRERRVDVYRGGRVVRSFKAVVGAPATPTPSGLFAILERIPLTDQDGFYGPWILTITGHSNVLDTFQGGDGRVAIHGRGGSSLLDPLGSARSHGCVRIDNEAIRWLAGIAQPGTPVEVS